MFDIKLGKRTYHISLLLVYGIINILCFVSLDMLRVFRQYLFVLGPVVLICVLIIYRKNIPKEYIYILILVVLLLLSLPFGDKGLGSLCNLVLFCTLICVMYFHKWDVIELRAFALCCIVIQIVTCFSARNYISQYYSTLYYSGQSQYINPNTIGLAIMLSSMLSIILYNTFSNNIIIMLLKFATLAGTAYSLYMLECRGALGAFIVFFLITFFTIPRLRNRRFCNLVFIIVVILSFLVPKIYLYMYSKNYTFNMLGIEKRFYSGREIIWAQYFEYARQNILEFFLGAGSKSSAITGIAGADMHNNSLALLSNYGFIVTAFFYGFVFYLYNKITKIRCDGQTFICCMALVASLIASWTEATIYFPPSYLFFAAFLGLAKHYSDERREVE